MCKFTGIYWLLGFWDFWASMSSRYTPPSPISLGSEDFRICFLVLGYIIRGLFPLVIPPSLLPPPFYRKLQKFGHGTVNLIWKTRQLEGLKL